MSASKPFLQAITSRRSIYKLNKNLPSGVTEAAIGDLVRETIKQTPSSFNNQSSRAVVLFGSQHDRLWDLIWSKLDVQDTYKDDAQKESTKKKNDSFKAAAGTILFFEDKAPVQASADKFKLYADQFPQWSEHSSGIAQAYTWIALSECGVGASLQHYGNLIQDDLKAIWGLPESWVIKAQMPFGGIGAGPQEKSFQPIEERVKTFGEGTA